MSDFKNLEDKLNHVDKVVTTMQATLEHHSEKFAETVRNNAVALGNHNTRISDLERSFHVYDGSIKTLNRLLSLFGTTLLAGVVWLFVQVHDAKRESAVIANELKQLQNELIEAKRELNGLKNVK